MNKFEHKRFLLVINYLISENIVKNKSELANIFDISPSKFSEILKKRMMPGFELYEILISKFNINSEWLLTGKGEILKSGSNIQNNTGNSANIIQNGNITGTINIGGEAHTKKSLEEHFRGMEHEISNLKEQINGLKRELDLKDKIIELLEKNK